jgi:hypothetical protein
MPDSLILFNLPSADDDRPLPIIVAEKWKFSLASVETPKGNFYAVQDWIKGLTTSDSHKAKLIWGQIKKQKLISNQPLSYIASDGKTYQRDFTDDKGLYLIAQHLRVTSSRHALSEIKNFLANAGVFVDEARRDPESAIAGLESWGDEREFNKLVAEGFTPEEAQQWLQVRHKQKRQRIKIVAVWQERGVKHPRDFAELTNHIHRVALGRTATRHKRELAVKDTPRNYVSAADNATLEITEFTSVLLHNHRESFGKPELSEDIEDVRPIIDAARPEIQRVFSQKPRRLPGGDRPQLPER